MGARMRQFRKERGMTLRGLSAGSGLSIGFLSQVERGISTIGLVALNSVAAALDRGVAEFFDDSPGHQPGRDAERLPEHFTLTRAQTAATEYVSGGPRRTGCCHRAGPAWCWSRCWCTSRRAGGGSRRTGTPGRSSPTC
ncbi:helix-turn-helix domain-containing protein [Nonomuraea ferruginea]